ncbi:MAG: hypothetical protein KAS32_05815, partial [Candidatus Peribacteraceae bacterium]|nr:hypothetical protein [Candidatus Peribacteraceae bacterium]
CSNCPSELGCVKAVYIGILDLEVTIKSITKDDYREKVEAVIAAESIESVKGIVLGAIPNST